jgi:hypothetical protein
MIGRHIVLTLAAAGLVSASALSIWACGTVAPTAGASDSGVAGADAGGGTKGSYFCPPTSGGGADAGVWSPSNFAPSALDEKAYGDVHVSAASGECAFDTDALTLTCDGKSPFKYSVSVVPQKDGPELAVYSMAGLELDPGVMVRGVGSRPLVLFAHDSVSIGGELRLTGVAPIVDGGPGRQASGAYGSAGPGEYRGGASFCGTSGDGKGPAPYGAPSLEPLQGGSAAADPNFHPSVRSYGGGAVQISSLMTIVIRATGIVDANGSGGVAVPDGDGTIYAGGASGGAILLEAPTISILGSLAANGGGGIGDGGTSYTTAPGVGCSAGGSGSAGDIPNGGAGVGACLGGGGAGWIALRAAGCDFNGTFSPSVKSGCTNVFSLAR